MVSLLSVLSPSACLCALHAVLSVWRAAHAHAQLHGRCALLCLNTTLMHPLNGQVLDFVRHSGSQERKVQVIVCLAPLASFGLGARRKKVYTCW